MRIIFGKKANYPTFHLLKLDLEPKGLRKNFDYLYYDLQTKEGYEEFKSRGFTDLEYQDFLVSIKDIESKLPIILEED